MPPKNVMTIRRTIIISLVFHTLVLFTAIHSVKSIQSKESVFSVELMTMHGNGDERGKDLKKIQAPVHTDKNEILIGDKNKSDKANPLETKIAGGSPELLPFEPKINMAAAALAEAYSHSAGSESHPGGSPPTGNQSSGARIADNQALISQIRASIEKVMTYPPLARRRRFEGTVFVRFRINEAGMPMDVEVVKSSGYRILDEEAVKAVIRAKGLLFIDGRIEIPISFRLLSP